VEGKNPRIDGLRLASVITALNVLIAAAFSIGGLIKPTLIVPPGSVTRMGRALRDGGQASKRGNPSASFAEGGQLTSQRFGQIQRNFRPKRLSRRPQRRLILRKAHLPLAAMAAQITFI
jgi:hypothetical protein